MSKTSYNSNEWAKAGFSDFVVEELVNAPNTEIQNRAQVSNSLKASMGIERVMFNSIASLPSEFGLNGEEVYELENKDSRIRFVGDFWLVVDAHGSRVQSSTQNNFMEVSFYGTGLNVLVFGSAAAADYRATVDGGATGPNFMPTISDVLLSRNADQNHIVPVTSGLSLGWHTIKVELYTVLQWLNFYGIEILNESTQLQVASGSAFSGQGKDYLSALSSTNYNEGVVGTRGARVVKYLKDGVIGSAVQEVDSTQKNLTLADHSNEEIIRKINFREFGAGRADDFSISTNSSSRAFTLDDGTTTLVGSLVGVNNYSVKTLFIDGATNFLTFTFVGTGLDITTLSNNGGGRSHTIYVDGVSVGTDPVFGNTTTEKKYKIVSGLPYGTHTVKILNNALGASVPGIASLIVYGPKKPSLPDGAIELADYNVMADFIANTTSGIETISIGTLRKIGMREMIYGGTWNTPSLDVVNFVSGWNMYPTATSSYVEYSFFGTGFDMRFVSNSGSGASNQATIDGATDFSSYTTSTYGGDTSFTAATGILKETSTVQANGSGWIVSGLSLGLHTVRLTVPNGVDTMRVDCFDVITPIHVNNTKVGSLALEDKRNFTPIPKVENGGVDLSKAKAWIVYDGINNKILGKSLNVSAIVDAGVGVFKIYFEKPFKDINYALAGTVQEGNRVVTIASAKENKQASNCTLNIYYAATAALNDYIFSVIFFGELENENNE